MECKTVDICIFIYFITTQQKYQKSTDRLWD